jgi:two-component system sensor histidine kinase MprB
VSLRRRITLVTACAVAAVCLVFGVASYAATRSKLYSSTREELASLTQPYLGFQGFDRRFAPGGEPTGTGTATTGTSTVTTVAPRPGAEQGASSAPGALALAECRGFHRSGGPNRGIPLGGARGYFQNVCPNGHTYASDGGKPRLPVTSRVIAVAKGKAPSFYFTAKVQGTEEEIYVVADRRIRRAVEAALPLGSVKSTLSGLLITYILLVAGGALLAGLIGLWIARGALSPITRFTGETEQVTSALERPRRLDEREGPDELRRLAASFNQTLDALERSVKAQQHLIEDASHELRTPMAALRSNIQIFLEADRLPVNEREDLQQTIVAELDDLTQLVADVLELARGTAPDEHVEPLELETIVRDEIDRARRRSPQLTFEIDLAPTTIDNSPDRVSRAVANVIDNARKWSPPNGTIAVQLASGVLTVRDHGPGFKDVDMEHVFDRFYRSANARRLPGSGLGLAIVKQAAEAHGGFVTVQNASEGGAIVHLSFGGQLA